MTSMFDHQAAVALLSQTDLFSRLSPPLLEAVAKVTRAVVFETDTVIVRQGDTGSELYIIAEGSVVVVREEPNLGVEQVLSERRSPESFGEMSLLTEAPRAATVRALEPTTCLVLAKASFDSVLEKLPQVAVEISRYLAMRLAQQLGGMGFGFVRTEEIVSQPDLIETFTPNLLRTLKVIPLRLEAGVVTVAMTRPHDAATLLALRRQAPGLSISPMACTAEDFADFAQRFLPPVASSSASLAGAPPKSITLEGGEPVRAPFDTLLAQAYAGEQGRVIVEPTPDGIALFAADSSGRLEPLDCRLDPTQKNALGQQLKALFGADTEANEVRTRVVVIDGRRCEVHLSRLQTMRGPRYAVGVTDPREAVPSPSALWPVDALKQTIEAAARGGGGAVLVVGPSHSGRSTTLYSLLRLFDQETGRTNALTLETKPLLTLDQIAQVRLPGDLLGQCEPQNLISALRVALEQKPDILMVDEPGGEGLYSVLEAAEDGLTVLTTMRGTDPITTLTGLLGRSNAPVATVENLSLILGQQLLRRICPHCRQEFSPSPAVVSQLELSGLGSRADRFFHGAGCDRCRGSGVSGKVAVFESLKLNPFLAEMMRARRSPEALRKAALSHGLLFPFKGFAKVLVAQGQILPTEALRLFGGATLS